MYSNFDVDREDGSHEGKLKLEIVLLNDPHSK